MCIYMYVYKYMNQDYLPYLYAAELSISANVGKPGKKWMSMGDCIIERVLYSNLLTYF